MKASSSSRTQVSRPCHGLQKASAYSSGRTEQQQRKVKRKLRQVALDDPIYAEVIDRERDRILFPESRFHSCGYFCHVPCFERLAVIAVYTCSVYGEMPFRVCMEHTATVLSLVVPDAEPLWCGEEHQPQTHRVTTVGKIQPFVPDYRNMSDGLAGKWTQPHMEWYQTRRRAYPSDGKQAGKKEAG